MQTSVENLSQLERRLNVALPVAQIESEVESRLKRIAQTAKISGFRPGKVPLKIVAQQYGSQVRQEVIGDVVQKSFGEAVKQQNFRVAGYPQIEAKPAVENSANFEFSATFEIYPEVAVGDIKAIKIERPMAAVGPADVEKTLEVLRKQRVQYETIDRAAAADDKVNIDFSGTLDGVEFPGGQAKGFEVILGAGRMLPVFEENITGLKAGEKKTFELTFPEDYHGKDVAGKTAIFEVTINTVAAPKLPELNADFVKTLGVASGDLSQLQSEVKTNLELEVKRRTEAKTKDQVMQGLLDTTQVQLPKALVDMEIQRLKQQARQDLEARGIKNPDLPMPDDIFQQQAERRVSLGLILSELVKANKLEAKPEQVRALIEENAQSYEHPQEVINWYYQQRERLNDVEALVLESNVVSWVLSQAKVEDKPIAFDELMGNA